MANTKKRVTTKVVANWLKESKRQRALKARRALEIAEYQLLLEKAAVAALEAKINALYDAVIN
jgi:hypothetical protein